MLYVPTNASKSGRFLDQFYSFAFSTKLLSITLAPLKNSEQTSQPYYKLSGTSPTADEVLYLPPTQSQNSNTLEFSTPN